MQIENVSELWTQVETTWNDYLQKHTFLLTSLCIKQMHNYMFVCVYVYK